MFIEFRLIWNSEPKEEVKEGRTLSSHDKQSAASSAAQNRIAGAWSHTSQIVRIFRLNHYFSLGLLSHLLRHGWSTECWTVDDDEWNQSPRCSFATRKIEEDSTNIKILPDWNEEDPRWYYSFLLPVNTASVEDVT